MGRGKRVDRAVAVVACASGTWRGTTWAVAVAATYFLISYPMALHHDFATWYWSAFVPPLIAFVITGARLGRPRMPWTVLVFLFLGLESAVWSTNPHQTVTVTWHYALLAALAIVIASAVDMRVFAVGVTLGGAVIVIVSIYAYFADLPGAHVLVGSTGYLAGVGTNRNILAYTLVLAYGFAVSYVPRGLLRRLAWAAALAMILLGIFLAQSATGIFSVAVLTVAAVGMGIVDVTRGQPPARRRRYLAAFAAGVLTVGAVAVAWYESLNRSLSRDMVLTGRIQIWEAAWDNASRRERLTGSGWGAVWPHPWFRNPVNPEFREIVAQVGRHVAHGHNSAFDLLPELGLVGVFFFGLIYVEALVRAVAARRRRNRGQAEYGRATILGIIALLMCGVTEPMSTIPLGFLLAAVLAAGPRPRATARVEVVPGRHRSGQALPSTATTPTK